ncbi:DUF2489 domain-containing protein [Aliiglaciecola sp. 3_MG-2023]|uniref:DUF2489 domain-containing protein n=1 Tax=Aliiglaciecola sp. 3_MG-2023 TaxID=3062644 RepID=UPI0026E1F785|nr:DUF2489 domain-containing protein [Aliiglaciecola sp. 3_MG-2023]MDO6695609.1 DUF2489 domain-containing protein [Aliiglaciecola sp. 3_MG-2023]
MSILEYTLIAIAILIISALSFYAGKLLFQLKRQNQVQRKARQERVVRIMESVHTIAWAVEQQQCNLSEGAIRLVNLLDSVPVESPPNCKRDYPNLYSLFLAVRELPTHQQRKDLPAEIRAQQDQNREEQEAKLESGILKEMVMIRSLSFN